MVTTDDSTLQYLTMLRGLENYPWFTAVVLYVGNDLWATMYIRPGRDARLVFS